MPQNAFHTVDMLVTAKYADSQLAVLEDADALRSEQMTALANKMNHPEAAFIEDGPPDGGYDVRIFTSDGEIPFVGHPALGAAAVLRDHFGVDDEVTLNLGIGLISIRIRGDGSDNEQYRMTQNAPRSGAELDRETLAEVPSLDTNDLDVNWPIQIVSTGPPAVMIPLRDRGAFIRSEVFASAYRSFFDDMGVENLSLFCPDPRDDADDLTARVYAPDHGVAENPAAESVNGCFAGYPVRHRYFGGDGIEVTVEQDYEMD